MNSRALLRIKLTAALAYIAFLIPLASNAGGLTSALSYANIHSAAKVDLPPAGTFDGCTDHFPKRNPISVSSIPKTWKVKALCFNEFAVVYSGLSKTPMVVAEKLNRAKLASAKDEKRTNEFFPDHRLPSEDRAELSDYEGSGYDRGHNAPAADAPDHNAMAQSFSLSNMVPQDPTHNRKIWSKIESDVRKFTRRTNGDVFVFTGPLFKGERHQTIGRNRVWVPTHMFKLVYDESSGRSWAYILPNRPDAQIIVPMDYPNFVKETGMALLGKPV